MTETVKDRKPTIQISELGSAMRKIKKPMDDFGRATPKIELYKPSTTPKIDPLFADLDNVIKKMHDYIPFTNNETLYLFEVEANMKVFKAMMFLGIVMFVTAILWSL